jgi:hypothetical protein
MGTAKKTNRIALLRFILFLLLVAVELIRESMQLGLSLAACFKITDASWGKSPEGHDTCLILSKVVRFDREVPNHLTKYLFFHPFFGCN